MEALYTAMDRCLLREERPSGELEALARREAFGRFPFSLLLAEKTAEQSPEHHPEGSVWNHTMLVVDEAAGRKQYSSDSRVFMWAALLHDIGKPPVTKKRRGKITAYNHDREGAALARRFLLPLTREEDFVERVAWLVRYHMQLLYVVKNLPFQDLPGMRAYTHIEDVALLGFCDRLGRSGADEEAERREVLLFLEKCGERRDVPWLRPE